MYTARGRVWVRPGRFPANVMVAPNSPRARAQVIARPAMSDGIARGSRTRRNVYGGVAPRVTAASRYLGSTSRSHAAVVDTKNGMATNASAITTARVVN